MKTFRKRSFQQQYSKYYNVRSKANINFGVISGMSQHVSDIVIKFSNPYIVFIHGISRAIICYVQSRKG
jgi:hypothetical protein